MGQVLQAGQGQIPSRQAQIKAGIPKEVSSETVNKVCASGVRAVGILDAAIRAGDVEVGVGGGMESMSQAPYLLPQAPLRLPHGRRQGARRDGPRRADQPVQRQADVRRGHRGRRRARDDAPRPRPLGAALARARDRGDRRGPPGRRDRLRDGQGPQGRHVVEVDEAPRRGSTLEALAKLPGLTSKEGSHTAGNSPGVNDGAGALVVASDEWAKANGKEVLAEILGQAQTADDFAYLARTPATAGQKLLDKLGMSAQDVDLWEINEAFASVTLNSMRMLGIDEEKVNVNGGAVALGHPIGASGARIIASLVHELRRRGGGVGCAAICSGGGQGDAVLIRV
jgi:acetyl-CoA C-acetyltransferase